MLSSTCYTVTVYFSRPGSFESGEVVFTVFSSIVTSAHLVAFTHARVCPDNKFHHKVDTSFDKDDTSFDKDDISFEKGRIRHKVDTSFEKGQIRGQIKGKDVAHELYFDRNGKSDCRLPFLAL